MAQAMILPRSFCGQASTSTPLKKRPLSFNPNCSSSQLFFSSVPPRFPSSSSSPVTPFALFKSKTKAPPSKKVEKPKPRVEDGIFGTSGGIGFTKQNELFVGRVAMLGFAVSITQSFNFQFNCSFQSNRISETVRLPQTEIHETKKRHRTAPPLVATALALSLLLGSATAAHGGEAPVRSGGGAALFSRACIGCHDAGGNVIQPGATLFAEDLERNGVATEDEIFRVTYAGKGRMPGFGEECTPRGQCTFGPRLNDDEIRLLAQFVKSQAQQGWPKTD